MVGVAEAEGGISQPVGWRLPGRRHARRFTRGGGRGALLRCMPAGTPTTAPPSPAGRVKPTIPTSSDYTPPRPGQHKRRRSGERRRCLPIFSFIYFISTSCRLLATHTRSAVAARAYALTWATLPYRCGSALPACCNTGARTKRPTSHNAIRRPVVSGWTGRRFLAPVDGILD